MEITEKFLNWNSGGNNYILKADSKNRWVGFNKSVIDQLLSKFSNNFNLVIWGTQSETDYYCIPFKIVEHLFTKIHMTKGEKAEEGLARWTATIENHLFKMHSNSIYSANIEKFYGLDINSTKVDYEDLDKSLGYDFTIEDAKANVKIRLGQSVFRKSVLKNFDYKCCISEISETSLLVASHIVPWASNKNFRSDPSNGLCLFIEYDYYFDQGYITIDNDLKIKISKYISNLSINLQKRLLGIEGKKILEPKEFKINKNYIKFHNDNIFDSY